MFSDSSACSIFRASAHDLDNSVLGQKAAWRKTMNFFQKEGFFVQNQRYYILIHETVSRKMLQTLLFAAFFIHQCFFPFLTIHFKYFAFFPSNLSVQLQIFK